MNSGERDELIVKIKLIELRDKQSTVSRFGRINQVGASVSHQYKSLPADLDLTTLRQMSNTNLANIATSLRMKKADSSMKADVIVNGKGISIKSNQKAPPAIINHTHRSGFVFAAQQCIGNMAALDKIVAEYWVLREAGKIGEDLPNSNGLSPFAKNKTILRPFLSYFLFEGTGSKLSSSTADEILGFTNPLDAVTWTLSNRTTTIDLLWSKLVFSIRSKGMPSNYPNVSTRMAKKKSSIDIWTKLINGKHKGSLHVRVGH